MRKTLFSLALLLGAGGAWAQGLFVASYAPAKDDVLSFGVMSDTHFENNKGIGAARKVPRAISSLTSKRALDALVVVGDLSDGGKLAQYQQFAKVFSTESNFKNPVGRKLFLMGNHDNYDSNSKQNYAQALASFNGGKNYPLDQFLYIKGYPFILVSQRNGSNTDTGNSSAGEGAYPDSVCQKVAGWLAEAEKACPGKPIFVFVHVPPTNTMYSSWATEGDGTKWPTWSMTPVGRVLAKYPQAIVFSGHSHFPMGDPRSIHQGVDPTSSRNNYYTAIGTGSTTYSEIPNYVVDEGIHPAGYDQVTEGLIVTVKASGDVVVHRYDTYRDTEMHPEAPWTIKAPFDGSTFTYADKRDSLELKAGQPYRDGLPAPEWPAQSTASAKPARTGATVTWPQATDNDCVFRYRARLRNADGRVLATRWIFSKFFLGTDMPDSLSATFTGLQPAARYEVDVTAYDSYDNTTAEPLTASFVTLGGSDSTAAVPEAEAVWTFDDAARPTANAVEGSALTMSTGTVSDGTVTLTNAAGLTSIDGPDEKNKAVRVPANAVLQVASGTDESIGTYTLMWDVRIASISKFHALLQADPTNARDASFFINKSGKVGLGVSQLGYGGDVSLNTWHRIVLVVKDGVPTSYLDGDLLREGSSGSSTWTLRGGRFYLFCDNDGEDDQIDAAEVRYWNSALTSEQVQTLGKVPEPDYIKTDTRAVSVDDANLTFSLNISASVKPTITLPEWIHALDAIPAIGDNLPYTYRCDSMTYVGTRTDSIKVSAPEGSDVEPLYIVVTQTNRGDVLGTKLGDWTFADADDLLANSVTGSPLSLVAGQEGNKSFTASTPAAVGIATTAGPTSTASAVKVPKAAAIKLQNASGQTLDTWTFMMDLYVPTAAKYVALFQSDVANNNDADVFLKGTQIGLSCSYWSYGGQVSVGAWHRVVIVVKDGAPTSYVDGVLAKAGTTGSDRWQLKAAGSLFFCDNDGEDADVYVSRLTIWPTDLSADMIEQLGTAQ